MKKVIFINGTAVPKPLSMDDEASIMGKQTFHVKFTNQCMYQCNQEYKGTVKQRSALYNGMMHLTKENAQAHAIALSTPSCGLIIRGES